MRETRYGRTFHAIWQGLRASAPQASALAKLRHSPNRGQRRLHSSTRTSATFRDSRASRLARSPGALALPKRYQHHI